MINGVAIRTSAFRLFFIGLAFLCMGTTNSRQISNSEFSQTLDPTALLQQAQNAPNAEIRKIQDRLRRIPLAEFNSSHQRKVQTLISKGGSRADEWILIAGFLGMCDYVQSIRYDYENGTDEKQAVNLALTRCGTPEKVASLLRNAKKIPVEDNFIYEVAPKLIYTRQKAILNYLFEIVMSDAKSCNSSGEYERAIPCAYRLIEMLAPAINQYPFGLSASGDLEQKDYKFALATIRRWYTKNKNTYQPNLESY